jgi:recombination associated protein RdgC
MFKQVQIYRLPHFNMKSTDFEKALSQHNFYPPTASALISQGFTGPRDVGYLHVVGDQWLIQLTTEKKILPSSVVNQVAKTRAAELEEQQGFAPGKKAMRELKERVFDELLPKAFSARTHTRCWIDRKNGWLVVDGTASKADDVIKLLLKAIDRFPVESMRVVHSPVRMMTSWLEHDDSPAGFTIDQDATMRATGESKAQVTYKRHTLEPDAMRGHIKAGKQCTKLAMTWDSKISFVLTEELAIKSIKLLDVMAENVPANDVERFDGEFALFAGEFGKLLGDLTNALGGMAKEQEAA